MEWNEFFLALGQTVAMTLIAAVLAYLVGLPLGVLLYTTGKKEMLDIFASEGHDPKYYGELMPIDIYMKRDWESYIHSL